MREIDRAAAGLLRRFGRFIQRVAGVWSVLPYERRLAAGASLTLFVTLFLPWYQETVIASERTSKLLSASDSVTGWGAFSFVEAAVLLVALGVLTLLFQRAEGRAFHLPGGDGWVITIAGAWTCCLVVWRIFDKQGASTHNRLATTSGIEWGIFVALLVAGVLTYSGNLIRVAHAPEPPLPGDPDPAGVGPRAPAAAGGGPAGESPASERSRQRRAQPAAPSEAATIAKPSEAATVARPSEDPPTPRRRVKRAPGQPASRPPSANTPGERRVGWLTAPRDGTPGHPPEPTTPRVKPSPPAWSYQDEVGDKQEPDHAETLPTPPRRRRRPADEQLTIDVDTDDQTQ